MERIMNRLLYILILLLGMGISAASDAHSEPLSVSHAGKATAQPDAAVMRQVRKIMLALHRRDMIALSRLVHTGGVRFRPYLCEPGQRFRPARLLTLLQDPTRYYWGIGDISVEPIRLTFKAYYRQFIYLPGYPFAHASNVLYGKVGIGVMAPEYYKHCLPAPSQHTALVEYAWEKQDSPRAGLILILRKQGKQWKLAEVIHEIWTI
jgi:hypothetical protein